MVAIMASCFMITLSRLETIDRRVVGGDPVADRVQRRAIALVQADEAALGQEAVHLGHVPAVGGHAERDDAAVKKWCAKCAFGLALAGPNAHLGQIAMSPSMRLSECRARARLALPRSRTRYRNSPWSLRELLSSRMR